MRVCPIPLLALAPLLGLTSITDAHTGDQVYLFYELLDEDLDRIDLTDGSIEDWYRGAVPGHLGFLEGRGGLAQRSHDPGCPRLARLARQQQYPLGRRGGLR